MDDIVPLVKLTYRATYWVLVGISSAGVEVSEKSDAQVRLTSERLCHSAGRVHPPIAEPWAPRPVGIANL
jgi:hypothetical protein